MCDIGVSKCALILVFPTIIVLFYNICIYQYININVQTMQVHALVEGDPCN